MPEPPLKCHIKDIPRRLHQRCRAKQIVASDDRLYIRHLPLAEGETYEFGIPGYRCLDQSANSHKLNRRGDPRDVLYDTKKENHNFHYQIARIDVAEVKGLEVPNANTIVKAEDGTIRQDIFTFDVEHDPTACMYPHCVINAKKNGRGIRKVASGVTTAIKVEFGQVAERHRYDMQRFQRPRIRAWDLVRTALLTFSDLLRYVGYRVLHSISD